MNSATIARFGLGIVLLACCGGTLCASGSDIYTIPLEVTSASIGESLLQTKRQVPYGAAVTETTFEGAAHPQKSLLAAHSKLSLKNQMPDGYGDAAPLDARGFLDVTSMCCPMEMERFFTRVLDARGLHVCSKPHVQGLMHWFSCVPEMDFQYPLDVIEKGNPCKFWAPVGQACPELSAACAGTLCGAGAAPTPATPAPLPGPTPAPTPPPPKEVCPAEWKLALTCHSCADGAATSAWTHVADFAACSKVCDSVDSKVLEWMAPIDEAEPDTSTTNCRCYDKTKADKKCYGGGERCTQDIYTRCAKLEPFCRACVPENVHLPK